MNKTALLRDRIKAVRRIHGYTNEYMGFRMGMSERTWRRKAKHPEMFKLSEIQRLESVLGTSLYEVTNHDYRG